MQWHRLAAEVLPLLAVISPLIGVATTSVICRWNALLVRSMAQSNAIMTMLLTGAAVAVCDPHWIDEEIPPVKQSQAANSAAAVAAVPPGTRVRLSFELDGLRAWPALLLALTTWGALCFPGNLPETSYPAFGIRILLSESLLLGSLFASDGILTLILVEAALVPLYLLIGFHGDVHRRRAANAFWAWQFIGCSCSLLGITLLAVSLPWMQSDFVAHRRPVQFDTALLLGGVQQLLERSGTAWVLWGQVAPWGFALLAVGFFIRIPVFPFQGWYTSTLSAAPAGGSALIVTAFPMIALCDWYRLAGPLCADGVVPLMGILGTIAMLGLWNAAILSQRQADLKQLVITISAGMLCLACLGLSTQRRDGIPGCWLLALSQGLAAAVGILVIDLLESRSGARDLSQLESLTRSHPRLAAILVVTWLGWAGMPCLSAFAALYLVFSASTATNIALLLGEMAAVAVFAKSAISTLGVFATNGALESASGSKKSRVTPASVADGSISDRDLSLSEMCVFVPFLILIALMNFAPSVVLSSCETSFLRVFRRSEQHNVSRSVPDNSDRGSSIAASHAMAE